MPRFVRAMLRAPWVAVGGLLALYLGFGAGYALRTPLWQNPDEPAHYNYLHQIAGGDGIPVLQSGDYDQRTIEQLVATGFPEGVLVDSLRYEGHQPPLFYLAAAPLDAVLARQPLEARVRAVRLLSLLLGAGVVALAYACGRAVFPHEPAAAVGVAVVPALLPQHVAVAASVNNDALSWLLGAAVLLLCLRLAAAPHLLLRTGWATGLGLLMGAVLLTKTTAYAAVALPALTLVFRRLQGQPVGPGTVRGLLGSYAIAALAGTLWFGRNLMVYGGLDFLGLTRHNAIAVGQPPPLGWGLPELRTLLTTLFQSSWVQLGWMTVPARPWVYGLLAAVTGVLVAGAVLALRNRGSCGAAVQRAQLWVLVAAALLAVAQVAYYNLQFLQPQGRYLFSALIPFSSLAVVGLRRLAGDRGLPGALGVFAALLVWLNTEALTTMLGYLRGGA